MLLLHPLSLAHYVSTLRNTLTRESDGHRQRDSTSGHREAARPYGDLPHQTAAALFFIAMAATLPPEARHHACIGSHLPWLTQERGRRDTGNTRQNTAKMSFPNRLPPTFRR
ncbi:MAG TPA: hypothetical protein VGN34_17105 [Ktedonobacteraceae bacterium]